MAQVADASHAMGDGFGLPPAVNTGPQYTVESPMAQAQPLSPVGAQVGSPVHNHIVHPAGPLVPYGAGQQGPAPERSSGSPNSVRAHQPTFHLDPAFQFAARNQAPAHGPVGGLLSTISTVPFQVQFTNHNMAQPMQLAHRPPVGGVLATIPAPPQVPVRRPVWVDYSNVEANPAHRQRRDGLEDVAGAVPPQFGQIRLRAPDRGVKRRPGMVRAR